MKAKISQSRPGHNGKGENNGEKLMGGEKHLQVLSMPQCRTFSITLL